MDGLAIRMLSQDWQEKFTYARIDKIHQPTERELVLTIRTRKETVKVLLSAHRTFARAHELRLQKPTNPTEPPMFCMLMRKHIEGGKIVGVRQQNWDRVLEFLIETLDEIGDVKHYVLILEMMGKHSNLILCTTTEAYEPVKIVDSVAHVTPDISRYRLVLPGQPYKPAPPQDKVSPLCIEGPTLSDLFPDEPSQAISEKTLLRALTNRIAGIGPWSGKEVLHLARAAADSAPESDTERFADRVAHTIRSLYSDTLERRTSPSIGLDELGRPMAVAPFTFTAFHGVLTVADLSEGIERLYLETLSRNQVISMASDVERALHDRIDKLRGKWTKLQEEWTESGQHEDFRIKGDLLTAYAYQVEKGTMHVELPNFYDEERPLDIALDPALTAIENAQWYYKQSSKRKRARSIVQDEISATESDMAYLEDVLVHLRNATPDNLTAIRQELEEQGFLKPKARTKKQSVKPSKQTPAGQPDAYQSVNGITMRVGRNNLQNDRLTLKSSQPSDIWLHVKNLPGSHVVISTNRQDVPEATLHEAALLAAYFSKGKDSANVSVDYCEIRHVWKPNGARPGHVLYENQKTLSVTPDRTYIEPILQRKL